MPPSYADIAVGRGSSCCASCPQRPPCAVASHRRRAAPFFVRLVISGPLRAALHLPPPTASQAIRGIRRQTQPAELLAKASFLLVGIVPQPGGFDIGALHTPNPSYNPDLEARPAVLPLHYPSAPAESTGGRCWQCPSPPRVHRVVAHPRGRPDRRHLRVLREYKRHAGRRYGMPRKAFRLIVLVCDVAAKPPK